MTYFTYPKRPLKGDVAPTIPNGPIDIEHDIDHLGRRVLRSWGAHGMQDECSSLHFFVLHANEFILSSFDCPLIIFIVCLVANYLFVGSIAILKPN